MGKLIVIEGLDASGKTTQSEILSRKLTEAGQSVRLISFPNYGSDGSILVSHYLNGDFGKDPSATNAYAASMFFAADRYCSFKTDWIKDYNDPNTVIIANRYTTANAYHQISKLPKAEWDSFLDWLWDFEFSKLTLPRPDKVICLEMPPEVSARLLAGRCAETGAKKDIHESDGNYLSACHEAAIYTSKKLGWSLIHCSKDGLPLSREEVAAMIENEIKDIVPALR